MAIDETKIVPPTPEQISAVLEDLSNRPHQHKPGEKCAYEEFDDKIRTNPDLIERAQNCFGMLVARAATVGYDFNEYYLDLRAWLYMGIEMGKAQAEAKILKSMTEDK